METAATIIIAVTGFATAIGSIMVSLLTARSSVHRGELEALQSTLATLQAENKRLTDRIAALEHSADADQQRIDTLEDQVRDLEAQVRALGAVPVTQQQPEKGKRK